MGVCTGARGARGFRSRRCDPFGCSPSLEDASSGLEVKEGSRRSPSLSGTEEGRDLRWLRSDSGRRGGARPRPSQGSAGRKGSAAGGGKNPTEGA